MMRLSRKSNVEYGSYRNPGHTSLFVNVDGNLVVEGHNIYEDGRSGAKYHITLDADAEDWAALLDIVKAGYNYCLSKSEETSLQTENCLSFSEDGSVWKTRGLQQVAGEVNRIPFDPGALVLLATADGLGALAEQDELSSTAPALAVEIRGTRGQELKVAAPVSPGHDHVAIISKNGKFLVFPLSDLPTLGTKKRPVRMQRYNMARVKVGTLELDGGFSDITTFAWKDGLSWSMGGGNTRHEPDMSEWLGKRAGVGKRPPYGFPRNNKFK